MTPTQEQQRATDGNPAVWPAFPEHPRRPVCRVCQRPVVSALSHPNPSVCEGCSWGRAKAIRRRNGMAAAFVASRYGRGRGGG